MRAPIEVTDTSKNRPSYGRSHLTWVDRLGVYLSQRAILNYLKMNPNVSVLDIGCGHKALHLTAARLYIKEGLGIDYSIDESVKKLPKLSFVEGDLLQILPSLANESFEVIILNSVLEHVNDPCTLLAHCIRLLPPGGALLLNVPTWFGKFFLETSAFHFGLSAPFEIDDHKMYYDKRDLWPLLVRVGFFPKDIKMSYHKLRMNLFCCCHKR
jgi:SAM-dependent methyltransferase